MSEISLLTLPEKQRKKKRREKKFRPELHSSRK